MKLVPSTLIQELVFPSLSGMAPISLASGFLNTVLTSVIYFYVLSTCLFLVFLKQVSSTVF